MIDKSKRQTLKGLAAVTGAAIAGTLPMMASAASTSEVKVTRPYQVWPPVALPQQIAVTTRISTEDNDLEVVLTNQSNQPVTITQLVPSQIDTARGSFEFSQVLENGPRQLKAGESIYVPIEHHSVVLGEQTALKSLQETLQTDLSIVTDADIFAAVNYSAMLDA